MYLTNVFIGSGGGGPPVSHTSHQVAHRRDVIKSALLPVFVNVIKIHISGVARGREANYFRRRGRSSPLKMVASSLDRIVITLLFTI